MDNNSPKKRYTFTDFLPLVSIFSLIALITLFHQYYFGPNLDSAMRIVMASFFLIFGFFKIINLKGFAQAYGMYDVIAKRLPWYGYFYPFLELTLGAAYLANWSPVVTNSATLVLMLVSAAGVFLELRKGKHITCACLGAVFRIPMTYVTLFEDLVMAGMALYMLVRR